jgi:hypothetical protein
MGGKVFVEAVSRELYRIPAKTWHSPVVNTPARPLSCAPLAEFVAQRMRRSCLCRPLLLAGLAGGLLVAAKDAAALTLTQDKVDEQSDLFFNNLEFRTPMADETGIYYNQRTAGVSYNIKRDGAVLLATGTTNSGVPITGVTQPLGLAAGRFSFKTDNGAALALYAGGTVTVIGVQNVTPLPVQRPGYAATFLFSAGSPLGDGQVFMTEDYTTNSTPARWGGMFAWSNGVWSELASAAITVPGTSLGPGNFPVTFRTYGLPASCSNQIAFTATGRSLADTGGSFAQSYGAYIRQPGGSFVRLLDTSMFLPGQPTTPITGFGVIVHDGTEAAVTVAANGVNSSIVSLGVQTSARVWVDRFSIHPSPSPNYFWTGLQVVDYAQGRLLFTGDSQNTNPPAPPTVAGLYLIPAVGAAPVPLLDTTMTLDGKAIYTIAARDPSLTTNYVACRVTFTDFSEAIYRIYFSEPPAGPRISIMRSNTNVVLSWPLPATAFALEDAPLLLTNAWAAVPAPSVTNASTVSVTVPAIGRKFYRLRQL